MGVDNLLAKKEPRSAEISGKSFKLSLGEKAPLLEKPLEDDKNEGNEDDDEFQPPLSSRAASRSSRSDFVNAQLQ